MSDIKLSQTAQEILDRVEKLTLIEATDLVKALEEKFGVSAAAPVMVAAGGATADAADTKSIFDVELTSVGESKINVIKAVKEVTGLGLKEAKDLVDGAPQNIKTGVAKQDAEDIKSKVEAAGAVVTLK